MSATVLKSFTTVWNETPRTITITPSNSTRIVISGDDLTCVPIDRSEKLVEINSTLVVDWSKDTSLSASSRDDFISKLLALKTAVTLTAENPFLESSFNSNANYSREVLLGNLGTFTTSEVTFGNIQNWTKLSSAETMDVVSSSTADDLGGTGANTIFIIGVDNDYAEISEMLNMDGTTTVVTANSYLFINRVYVVFAGSGETNAGNITLTATTAGTQQGYVRAGISISEELRYCVPANKKGTWVYNIYETDKSSGQERTNTVRAYTYPGTIKTVKILAAQNKQSSDLNDTVVNRPFGGLLDPETIIYWTGQSNGTGTTARATVGLFFESTT